MTLPFNMSIADVVNQMPTETFLASTSFDEANPQYGLPTLTTNLYSTGVYTAIVFNPVGDGTYILELNHDHEIVEQQMIVHDDITGLTDWISSNRPRLLTHPQTSAFMNHIATFYAALARLPV